MVSFEISLNFEYYNTLDGDEAASVTKAWIIYWLYLLILM